MALWSLCELKRGLFFSFYFFSRLFLFFLFATIPFLLPFTVSYNIDVLICIPGMALKLAFSNIQWAIEVLLSFFKHLSLSLMMHELFRDWFES